MKNGVVIGWCRLLLAASLLAVCAGAQAGISEAVAAYKSGNFAVARQDLQPLADGGLAEAQFYIGLMYDNGDGVTQDYQQAMLWYRKAADQGFALAQSNLGVIYEVGGRVERNLKQAESWYLKAANQGDAAAQHNLASMYYVGRGEDIPRDYAKALTWYRKSAEQGNAASQNDLGQMYEFGQVVATDYAEAYKWYALAAEGGSEVARKNLESARLKITSEQMKKAEAGVKEWKATHKSS